MVDSIRITKNQTGTESESKARFYRLTDCCKIENSDADVNKAGNL